MQTLDWPSKSAYEQRLFSSHDFGVHVDILDFDEYVQGTAVLLDGQVDLVTDQPSRRTASLTLSDPEGALDFTGAAAWSGTSLWVNRLIRIRHTITVNGQNVTATVFVGPPTQMARDGAEVNVTCADKAELARFGALPYTVHKGAKATDAIQEIMQVRTGELRFRFPASNGRRLSKDYSVGLDATASPWQVCTNIAKNELGMELLYSCDGALLLRKLPSTPCATLRAVTAQASDSADFSTFSNYIKALGKLSTNKKGTFRTQPEAIITATTLSPWTLSRHGVPIYRPISVQNDAWTTQAAVYSHAKSQLTSANQVAADLQFSTIPVFHLDADDMVTIEHNTGSTNVRLQTGSIPLGVGGDMTIGWHRRVSSQTKVRSHVETLKWRHYTTGHKAHGKGKHHVKSTLKGHWARV